MVINSGGVFESSMLGGADVDAGKVLIIFNTSDPVVIGYGESNGYVAATIIAPFATVVLVSQFYTLKGNAVQPHSFAELKLAHTA